MANENGRNLAALFTETKEELKEFAVTRIDMLKSEMRDKLAAWKMALPMLIAALLLGLTAWLVLTACLILAIANAFYGSAWAYVWSTIIVGGAYVLCAAVAATFALRGLKEEGIAPKRTLRVLQADRAWLSTEARSQI